MAFFPYRKLSSPETRLIRLFGSLLPGNMYLSRDNVVAHIVREIFPVETVASNNSLVSEIYRLFKLCLIDVKSKFFDDLCVKP